jgi:hypothetical protein
VTTRESYLARVSRDLRADAPPRDELHVEPIATIAVGRRELTLDVTTSGRHGTAARLTLQAPPPLHPGGIRRFQDVHLYVVELDALLAALTTARARLVASAPPSLAPLKPKAP